MVKSLMVSCYLDLTPGRCLIPYHMPVVVGCKALKLDFASILPNAIITQSWVDKRMGMNFGRNHGQLMFAFNVMYNVEDCCKCRTHGFILN